MLSKKSLVFLLPFILFTLSACSNSSDSKKEKVLVDELGESEKASCLFQPEAGEGLDVQILQKNSTAVASFQKHFNPNWLEAVKRTNGLETARAVELTSAQVFKMDGGDRDLGCPYFQFLKPAPTDLLNLTEENRKGDDRRRVLGLYLDPSDKTPSIQTLPAIMVKTKTDRYTLVHEFMHHNFSTLTVGATGLTSDQLKDKFKSTLDDIDDQMSSYRVTKSKENAQKLVQKLDTFVDLFDQLMMRFTLEEMTIETILGKAVEDGTLINIPRSAYKNGGFYIQSNGEKYKETAQFVRRFIKKYEDEFNEDHKLLYSHLDTKVFTLLLDRESEVERLISSSEKRRDKYSSPNSFGADAITLTSGGSRDFGCSHAHEIDEISELLQSRASSDLN